MPEESQQRLSSDLLMHLHRRTGTHIYIHTHIHHTNNIGQSTIQSNVIELKRFLSLVSF